MINQFIACIFGLIILLFEIVFIFVSLYLVSNLIHIGHGSAGIIVPSAAILIIIILQCFSSFLFLTFIMAARSACIQYLFGT